MNLQEYMTASLALQGGALLFAFLAYARTLAK